MPTAEHSDVGSVGQVRRTRNNQGVCEGATRTSLTTQKSRRQPTSPLTRRFRHHRTNRQIAHGIRFQQPSTRNRLPQRRHSSTTASPTFSQRTSPVDGITHFIMRTTNNRSQISLLNLTHTRSLFTTIFTRAIVNRGARNTHRIRTARTRYTVTRVTTRRHFSIIIGITR